MVFVGTELLSPNTTEPERFASVTRTLLPITTVLFAVTLMLEPNTCELTPL